MQIATENDVTLYIYNIMLIIFCIREFNIDINFSKYRIVGVTLVSNKFGEMVLYANNFHSKVIRC